MPSLDSKMHLEDWKLKRINIPTKRDKLSIVGKLIFKSKKNKEKRPISSEACSVFESRNKGQEPNRIKGNMRSSIGKD